MVCSVANVSVTGTPPGPLGWRGLLADRCLCERSLCCCSRWPVVSALARVPAIPVIPVIPDRDYFGSSEVGGRSRRRFLTQQAGSQSSSFTPTSER